MGYYSYMEIKPKAKPEVVEPEEETTGQKKIGQKPQPIAKEWQGKEELHDDLGKATKTPEDRRRKPGTQVLGGRPRYKLPDERYTSLNTTKGASPHSFWCDDNLWQMLRAFLERKKAKDLKQGKKSNVSIRAALEEAVVDYLKKNNALRVHLDDVDGS